MVTSFASKIVLAGLVSLAILATGCGASATATPRPTTIPTLIPTLIPTPIPTEAVATPEPPEPVADSSAATPRPTLIPRPTQRRVQRKPWRVLNRAWRSPRRESLILPILDGPGWFPPNEESSRSRASPRQW